MGNPENENLVKQRENLSKTKLNLKESMQDPKLSSILADSYAKITAQLDCIDNQINVKKYIIWNISECAYSIENVCSVCETQDILGVHRGKKEVLWEKVQPGSSFLIDDENNIIICNVENISDTNKPEVGIQNLYTSYVYSNDGNR